MPRASTRYTTAQRLEVLRLALEMQSLSYAEIEERLEISHSTAQRLLRVLATTHELLEEEDGRSRRPKFRIARSAKGERMQVSALELLALFSASRLLSVFEGTGLGEDHAALTERLASLLRPADVALLRDLDRKVHHVVSGGRRFYEDRLDDVNEAMTALLRNHRLDIVYPSAQGEERCFVFEPYSLLFYKTGLYLAGHSAAHGRVITLALDRCISITWRKDDAFVCPADYSPRALVDGAFGLMRGEEVQVRVRFDADVARFVERAEWHPTQELSREEDGRVMLTMRVAGVEEVASWVLSWGAKAEVLEPRELRERVAEEMRRGAARYS